MTGLPQGVTLDQSAARPPEPHAVDTVLYLGQDVGDVWDACAGDGSHYAQTQDGAAWKRLPSHAAAVRWVCLQARPVVYQVRPVRGEVAGLIGWDVIDPGGEPMEFGGTEAGRVLALTVAHAEAARLMRLAAVRSG